MAVKEGDKVPSAKLKVKTSDGIKDVNTDEYFKGRKVVLFALPGAFTPTCSAKHVPGFVQNYDQLKQKGVDKIACVSVNDAFVMEAWGRDQKCDSKVDMLADGNGDFTRALGLEMDASAYGMGTRSTRYAIYAEDGVAKQVLVEAPGEFRVSSADHVLSQLS